MDMGFFRRKKADEPKGYRGIKRTGEPILTLARGLIHNHLLAYVDEGEIDDADIGPHVDQCIAQLRGWPESMTITYLLRDLDPEDFYSA